MNNLIIPDFYLIRSPFLPVDILEELNSIPNKSSFSDYENHIKKLYEREDIKNALHCAVTEEFYSEFTKWMNLEMIDPKERERMLVTLYKYLSRMTTRSVPFGLFSGFSIGEVNYKSTSFLRKESDVTVHTRLDMDYLQYIVDKLKCDESIIKESKFYTNSSLYKVGNQYKFIQYSLIEQIRKYNYSVVDCNEILDKIIFASFNGIKYKELVNIIVDYDSEVDIDEANSFLLELIEMQILFNELELSMTGRDNLERIISIISEQNIKTHIFESLIKIDNTLRKEGYSLNKHYLIKSSLDNIVGKKTHWSVLQADLQINFIENYINEGVIKEITYQLNEIRGLARNMERKDMNKFKNDFSEKFGEQQIPLLIALDSDIGVGYGSLGSNDSHLLLEGLYFNGNSSTNSYPQDKYSEVAMSIYNNFIKKDTMIVQLSDEDAKVLNKTLINDGLPESFFLHGVFISENGQGVEKGNYKFLLKNISGPPSCLTIGRFCAVSEELTSKVRKIVSIEESNYPEDILAEVSHLPHSRVGNVLFKPTLRRYEIPYLSTSDSINKIHVQDLKVSIRDGKVKLFSEKLGKEIHPRITNAHAFADAFLPVYKFLGEVQRDGKNDWMGWKWGQLSTEKILPRVEYKNIILSPAKWQLNIDDVPFVNTINTLKNIKALFQAVFCDLKIPRYVCFSEESDKEFYVDTTNEIDLYILSNYIKKAKEVKLEEIVGLSNNLLVKDNWGRRFNHEVMIPLNFIRNSSTNLNINHNSHKDDLTRKFFIGSQWLYIKIYLSPRMAEKVIQSSLPLLIFRLKESNLIDSWFFLRYNDPDHHIRIRFNNKTNSEFWKDTIDIINEHFADLIKQSIIRNIQTDTYERELERYGYELIENCESLFHLDSELIFKFFNNFNGIEKDRILFAIIRIDFLLRLFNYDLTSKLILMNKLESYYYNEFGNDQNLLKQINQKFRTYKSDIEQLMSKANDPIAYNSFYEHLVKQSHNDENQVLVNSSGLKDKFNNKNLDYTVSSLVHMFVNRLFPSSQRKIEFVLCVFLHKYYLSALNRSK